MTLRTRVIIFDLGKVIVDFDHFMICKKMALYCPLTAREIYREIFNSGLEAQFDEGILTPRSFFAHIKRNVHFTGSIIEFKKIWNHIFTLNPGISQLITRLKRNYRLLCLSNTNKWHFEYCLKTFPVLHHFDDFILSYKIKKRKPDPAIFKEALAKAKCSAQECVYIDDIQEYVMAAEALGMRAIHFKSISQLKKYLISTA